MVTSQPTLRRTVLYERHVAAGARIVEFGGWLMPVQYTGIIDEHLAVRQAVGVFDVSHMGRLVIHGRAAIPFLRRMLTNDIARLAIGSAQYSFLCEPTGGVIDDLFVWRTGDDRFELIVNAANTAVDHAWLLDHTPDAGVTIEDRTTATAMLAIQGPSAAVRLQEIADRPLGAIGRRKVAWLVLAGTPATVYRGGYTGEDGFEVVVPAEAGGALWDCLVGQLGVKPCGLGARDTLRLEAGLPLYGHELDRTITPLEAGFDFAVRFDDRDFIGRDALLAQQARGIARTRVGFRLTERGIARAGQSILIDGQAVGVVSSGTFSPTLEVSIGMGYVPVARAAVGTPIAVDVRGRLVRGEIVALPFVHRR